MVPDFTTPLWNEAILITPRNGVQTLWNEAMVKQHCRRTGHVHYVFYVEDSCSSKSLSQQHRLTIAHMKLDKTNNLPNKIDLVIGMKAMLLSNTTPHVGLVNGS
ncbi:hypothetical protein H4582DRAFT_1803484 [Lactarius indigo]|nr:hypothetical protein H4582DRAFT_1803484 [Lactarius indigo]